MFIVEKDVTHNICDQKLLELCVRRRRPEVRVVRKRLADVARQGSLDGQRRLFVDGEEVRSGRVGLWDWRGVRWRS